MGKTIVITGASRGIGREIALTLAAEGANIVIAAKSAVENPRLPGTIHSVAAEVEAAGGRALALKVDVRNEDEVKAMVESTVKTFGGIDGLINNAGAISLTSTAETSMKRYDLMQAINVRATFLCAQACLPHLAKSKNPHIVSLSPPLSLDPRWLAGHVAYTLSKYGMSLCTLGMAEEFKPLGISVNSLWPKTAIYTAAIAMLAGEAAQAVSRKPAIVADAVKALLATGKGEVTGQLLLDEDFLRTRGVTEFTHYAYDSRQTLMPDLYVGNPAELTGLKK